MMSIRTVLHRSRLLPLGVLVGLSISAGACTYTSTEVVSASVPDDYRLRHPIAVTEADHSIVIFVGHARGGLSASQHADVMGLARNWVREGTGAILADLPAGTPNARASAATVQEIRAVLVAGGVPAHAVVLQRYHPNDPRFLAPIRLSYSKMSAVAGPCGVWPEDLGPSIKDPSYNENKPYYNFGCATQRNLAAMVENPSDLEQPRPENPAYNPRRSEAFEKYRKGEPTTTVYPEAEKAKLSDIGK